MKRVHHSQAPLVRAGIHYEPEFSSGIHNGKSLRQKAEKFAYKQRCKQQKVSLESGATAISFCQSATPGTHVGSFDGSEIGSTG
jgi:hypothetical protein